MTFDILQHLDQLKPDGGTNNPRGDHSFKCPVCDAPNFKVNVVTGKWFTYGCDCASTEEGKRAIRNALSPAKNHYPGNELTEKPCHNRDFQAYPAQPRYPDNEVRHRSKPIRPKADRAWTYCDQDGKPILEVRRSDDGKGNRKIKQHSLIKGRRPKDVARQVVPYGFHQAKQALEDGAAYVFIPEGEPCADAMRGKGWVAQMYKVNPKVTQRTNIWRMTATGTRADATSVGPEGLSDPYPTKAALKEAIELIHAEWEATLGMSAEDAVQYVKDQQAEEAQKLQEETPEAVPVSEAAAPTLPKWFWYLAAAVVVAVGIAILAG